MPAVPICPSRAQPVVSQLASSATTTAEDRLRAEREDRKLRTAAKAEARRAKERRARAERERRSRARQAEIRRAERKERLAATAKANEAARLKAVEERAQREAERKASIAAAVKAREDAGAKRTSAEIAETSAAARAAAIKGRALREAQRQEADRTERIAAAVKAREAPRAEAPEAPARLGAERVSAVSSEYLNFGRKKVSEPEPAPVPAPIETAASPSPETSPEAQAKAARMKAVAAFLAAGPEIPRAGPLRPPSRRAFSGSAYPPGGANVKSRPAPTTDNDAARAKVIKEAARKRERFASPAKKAAAVAAPAASVAPPTATVNEMLDEASEADFKAWKETFGKKYAPGAEEATAFANFAANARLSKTMNAILQQPATRLSARSDQPVPLGGAASAPKPAATAPVPKPAAVATPAPAPKPAAGPPAPKPAVIAGAALEGFGKLIQQQSSAPAQAPKPPVVGTERAKGFDSAQAKADADAIAGAAGGALSLFGAALEGFGKFIQQESSADEFETPYAAEANEPGAVHEAEEFQESADPAP